jgi:hypothetical protein
MKMRMSWPIIVAVGAALAVVGFYVAPVFAHLTHYAAKHVTNHAAKQACAAAAALKARCPLLK